jgi:hypothetical protein
MSEASEPMNEAFEHWCRPRDFEEVCVLTLADDCRTDEISWFSVGVDAKVRAGICGFVFELVQFSRRRPLEAGLDDLVRFMLLTYKRGGFLNWLHGERFVREWMRQRIMSSPPENFQTEGEAVSALTTVLEARRIRAELPRRLTNCGLSLVQIANAAGLFEKDVRRFATGQEEPSDAVALLISSTLDSLTTDSDSQHPRSKPCVVDGCGGTMHFHERQPVVDAPHTLEWPWRASWRCAKDAAHTQLATMAEERAIASARMQILRARAARRRDDPA